MKDLMKDTDNLKSLLVSGKLSRREFIGRMSALGAVAAIPGALQVAEAATPKRGGRLRVASSGGATDDDLDAGFHGSCCAAHTGLNQFAIRNCLGIFTADGSAAPELAESWESSPDASEWRFKLRQGVEFHNGKTMDSQDVVYSITGHMGEDSTSPAKPIVSQITEVKADGKDAVVFKLEGGNADFPVLMTDYHLVILPDGSEMREGIGTGPFSVASYEPGVRFMGKRHPNYFKEGKPYFDELENLNINDVNTKVNALKTGEVDLIDHPDLKTIHLLEKTPGIDVVSAPGFRHYTMPMLTDTAPYDNNDVRLALKYAIPRQQVLDKVLRGKGQLGNDHPISPANQYHNAELPQREFDPDKAKFHLKKAGAEGLTFDLNTADAAFGGAVDSAVLIAEAAGKAGININVVRQPNDGYWSNVWRVLPWCFCYWSGRPTEDWMFSTAYSSGVAWNDARWEHARFNKLLVMARGELDTSRRREMYYEMQAIVRDEGGTAVPLFADQVGAASTKLKYNTPIAGHYEFDGQRAQERWWFA